MSPRPPSPPIPAPAVFFVACARPTGSADWSVNSVLTGPRRPDLVDGGARGRGRDPGRLRCPASAVLSVKDCAQGRRRGPQARPSSRPSPSSFPPHRTAPRRTPAGKLALDPDGVGRPAAVKAMKDAGPRGRDHVADVGARTPFTRPMGHDGPDRERPHSSTTPTNRDPGRPGALMQARRPGRRHPGPVRHDGRAACGRALPAQALEAAGPPGRDDHVLRPPKVRGGGRLGLSMGPYREANRLGKIGHGLGGQSRRTRRPTRLDFANSDEGPGAKWPSTSPRGRRHGHGQAGPCPISTSSSGWFEGLPHCRPSRSKVSGE